MLSKMWHGCPLSHIGIVVLKNPEYIRAIKKTFTFLYKTELGNQAGTLKGLSSLSVRRTLTVSWAQPGTQSPARSLPRLQVPSTGLQPAPLLWPAQF